MPPPVDAAIARLAERQHGVVALRQLTELGLSDRAVRSRVAAGKLHRIHRGVYAVGHAVLASDGRRMAAVLALGPTAFASYRMGGAVLGILASGALEVTVPGRGGRGVPGIVVHRTRCLAPADVTAVGPIPCTALGRTLIDLAEVLSPRRLERACEQAEILRIYDQRAIDAAIARNPGRRGAKRLLRVIDGWRPGWTPTRNELEEAMLAISGRVGARPPLVNGWIPFPDGGGASPDFLWDKRIVEVDGYETHGTRRAFEHDRARDRRLKLMGFDVMHFTWRDVLHRPDAVARDLAAFLST